MEHNIKARIEKLQADKQKELDKLNAKFKEQQDSIVNELKQNISRLKSELKAAEKALQQFTGRVPRATSDGAKADGNYSDAILAYMKDGPKSKSGITAHCVNLGMAKNSVGVALSKLKEAGKVVSSERGVWKLADNN